MKKQSLIALFISSLVSTQLWYLPQKAIASDIDNSNTHNTNKIIAQNMSQLTEEKVLEIIKVIEKAESEKDVDTILNFLAPFVTSSITVETKETTITRKLEGKQAHQTFLINTFNTVKEREEINSYLTVTASADDEVITVSRLHLRELTTENGKSFLSSSNDVIRFALVNNQPMIVSITVQGWMEERP